MSRSQSVRSPKSRAFVRARSRDGRPSIRYEASVNGAPAKPIKATSAGSERRSAPIASKRYGVASSAAITRREATSLIVRIGRSTMGPISGSMWNGTPIPSSGSMMSA
jgi:hypothetical protein